MKYLSLLALTFLFCCGALSAKKRNGNPAYPTKDELRASLLNVIALSADSFRHIRKDWDPHPEDPAEIEAPHLFRGDKPGMFTNYKDGPRNYENVLQPFSARTEDSKQAFFKWQQLIAEALSEHLRTVPEQAARMNESSRYYYYPATRGGNGALLSLSQNGGDIRLVVMLATPPDLKIVHAYNDGAPYDGTVVMKEEYMYDSGFTNNHYTGDVAYSYHNGDRYNGYFVDGKPEGEGTFTRADRKESYTGTFLKGKYHGKGKLIKNEVGYTGDFINGDLVPGSFTTSNEKVEYVVTTPGARKYSSYSNSAAVVPTSGKCTSCRGTGLVSAKATCFSCHGTGSSGTGYYTHDAHGYETGYKSLGCSYCGGTGLYNKFKRCGDCDGKGRK
jgi:hypothetical protein